MTAAAVSGFELDEIGKIESIFKVLATAFSTLTAVGNSPSALSSPSRFKAAAREARKRHSSGRQPSWVIAPSASSVAVRTSAHRSSASNALMRSSSVDQQDRD